SARIPRAGRSRPATRTPSAGWRPTCSRSGWGARPSTRTPRATSRSASPCSRPRSRAARSCSATSRACASCGTTLPCSCPPTTAPRAPAPSAPSARTRRSARPPPRAAGPARSSCPPRGWPRTTSRPTLSPLSRTRPSTRRSRHEGHGPRPPASPRTGPAGHPHHPSVRSPGLQHPARLRPLGGRSGRAEGRVSARLDIAFFGSSLVSAYWNGAATYYRGLLRALADRGHRITFYEPDAYGRQAHRDIPDPDWAEVVVYPADRGDDAWRVLEEARDADLLVKASGVGVFDDVLEAGGAQGNGPGRAGA